MKIYQPLEITGSNAAECLMFAICFKSNRGLSSLFALYLVNTPTCRVRTGVSVRIRVRDRVRSRASIKVKVGFQ